MNSLPKKLEESIRKSHADLLESNNKDILPLALFDMDNTLLIGDIGEAVYAQLRAEDHKVHIGWDEYKKVLEEHGPSVAYRQIVSAKKGLSKGTLRKVTRTVMEKETHIIFRENENEIKKLPPKPNPVLNDLIALLRELKMEIFVITASSKHIADEIITGWFDIEEDKVYGVENKVEFIDEELILQGELIEPAPILEGKAEVYLQKIENKSPLIAVGDSLNDVPMMKLVPDQGLVIIVERNPEYTLKIINELGDKENIYVLQS